MSDIKLKNVLKFENSFCVLPFIHEHIDVNNVRKVCCISRDSITLQRQKEIKQLMFDNKPVPECVKCLEQEKVKTFSERQLNNKHWLKKYKIDFTNPPTLSYDLRYSNLCNLRCQTCNAKSSSEWARYLGQEKIYNTIDPNDYEIDKNAERIYLAGGEPFMIKSFSKMLSKLENKNCEIVINTNATILTDHMLQALEPFTNICFVLSIDGTGETIEKIRTLSNWEIIQNNIQILRDKLKPNFMVNTVLQKDNMDNIPQLAEWIDNQRITVWHTSILTEPKEYEFQNYNGVLSWDEELWNRNCVKRNLQSQNSLKYVQDYLTSILAHKSCHNTFT